jgi:hypothetical protein
LIKLRVACASPGKAAAAISPIGTEPRASAAPANTNSVKKAMTHRFILIDPGAIRGTRN